MKTIAIIPARGGSKRQFNKNIWPEVFPDCPQVFYFSSEK
jgi:CMP-N-acetylneuraminic acid synthetase